MQNKQKTFQSPAHRAEMKNRKQTSVRLQRALTSRPTGSDIFMWGGRSHRSILEKVVTLLGEGERKKNRSLGSWGRKLIHLIIVLHDYVVFLLINFFIKFYSKWQFGLFSKLKFALKRHGFLPVQALRQIQKRSFKNVH